MWVVFVDLMNVAPDLLLGKSFFAIVDVLNDLLKKRIPGSRQSKDEMLAFGLG